MDFKGKNIAKLQDALLDRLQNTIKNGHFKVKSKDEKLMNIMIDLKTSAHK